MSATTLDELKAKVSTDSDIIASLSKSICISVRYQSVFFRSVLLVIWGHRLLKVMDKIDSACFECVEKCDNDFKFRYDLKKAADMWSKSLEKKEQMKFPAFLMRWERNIIESFENKVENYSLASDIEIKELANSISEKMNKKHAPHAIH